MKSRRVNRVLQRLRHQRRRQDDAADVSEQEGGEEVAGGGFEVNSSVRSSTNRKRPTDEDATDANCESTCAPRKKKRKTSNVRTPRGRSAKAKQAAVARSKKYHRVEETIQLSSSGDDDA